MTDPALARTARQAQWAVAIAGLLCAVAAVRLYLLVDDVALSGARSAAGAAARIGLLPLLVAGVFWVRWFSTLFAPFQRLRLTRFQDQWQVFGWFVPGASFVLPKMMVNDVWWLSEGSGRRTSLPWQVQTWWVLWAAVQVLGFTNGEQRASEAEDAGGVVVWVVYYGLVALCAPFAFKTIALLTSRSADLRNPE